MTPRRFAVAALVAALVLPGAARAGGIPTLDLGGAWTGTIKCKGTFGGAKDPFSLDPTIRITQIGTELGMLLDYNDPFPELYVALASNDPKKPDKKGEFMLDYCKTDDVVGSNVPSEFDELGRMTFSGKPGQVKATFKGTTVFFDHDFQPSGTYICKWKYTRTDVSPQGTQVGCTLNMMQVPPTK